MSTNQTRLKIVQNMMAKDMKGMSDEQLAQRLKAFLAAFYSAATQDRPDRQQIIAAVMIEEAAMETAAELVQHYSRGKDHKECVVHIEETMVNEFRRSARKWFTRLIGEINVFAEWENPFDPPSTNQRTAAEVLAAIEREEKERGKS